MPGFFLVMSYELWVMSYSRQWIFESNVLITHNP